MKLYGFHKDFDHKPTKAEIEETHATMRSRAVNALAELDRKGAKFTSVSIEMPLIEPDKRDPYGPRWRISLDIRVG